MVSEDPLDLAQSAIVRVADIASRLGVQCKWPICGRLGAELLLVADYLNTAGLDQEEQLRLRISKLLRDIEMICSWPHQTSGKSYPLLEAIAQAQPGSPRYSRAQAEIQQGLVNITSKTGVAAEEAILHIQKFTKRGHTKRREVDKDTPTKRNTPAEYSSGINVLVHNVLREHMCCTCNNETVQKTRGGHLARLLLRPSPQNTTDHGQVQFDMLFSSAPSWNGSRFGRWQDVQLLVPQVQKKSKKRARFSNIDSGTPPPLSPKQLMQVDRGQFCNLIRLEANSRICLTIQDGRLQKSGFEPLKQIVEHVPGISLANILELYHLTAKMKLALAYILALSVWQYYDSDWMKTRWTSETIQFLKECGSISTSKQGKLFAWKPYLSVRFGDEDPESGEFSDVDGEIHRYPRIRALGIMLVEIGIGLPLHRSDEERPAQSLAAKINDDLLLAIQYSKNEKLWGDCDYPNFLGAVNHCLDPGTFALAPCIRGVGDKEEAEGLKQRRNILYEKVVFPLEELLHGTRWMEQLTAIGPLETPAKSSAVQLVAEQSFADDAAIGPPPTRKAAKKTITKSEKESKRWLSRMQRLNSELAKTSQRMVPGSSSARVRIAVLDTGCDDNAPFFLHPDNGPRLKEWKDWVDGSGQWQDCHGHGTHLVSLIMKTAPEAHICVARIAKSPDTLLKAGENVAKAISWASKEWKADIISMSFGYAEEQQCISRAIRGTLYERDDSILFFAAASNYGANDMEMFPARHDSVISIRGTNSNGDFEDFNPPRNQNEETAFGTLGLDVPSAWLSDQDDEVCMSGTSIATAVAAGIAGVLLGYVNGKSKESAFQDVNKKLRTRQGMQAVFRALASPTLKERYLYLAPWKLMGKSDEVRWAIFVAALSDVS